MLRGPVIEQVSTQLATSVERMAFRNLQTVLGSEHCGSSKKRRGEWGRRAGVTLEARLRQECGLGMCAGGVPCVSGVLLMS